MSNVIVIAEVRGGSLKRPSLEAVTAAQQLAQSTGGQVVAVACGDNLDAAAAELAGNGAGKVVAIEGASFAHYSGDAYAKAVAEQVKAHDGAAVLMAHTAMGKDLLPRVSALLETGVLDRDEPRQYLADSLQLSGYFKTVPRSLPDVRTARR